jgi:hypothetical protein
MWPHFTNIHPNIAFKIKEAAFDTGSIAEKGYSAEAEYSKKNVWVRLISGADKGCIMVSNPDADLFQAIGDTTVSQLATYGYSDGSGAIGVDWFGQPVRAKDGWSGRPGPIITSLTTKEGKDQISRHCEIGITCYTLGQMELVQKYFMEPGYSLLVEYGFNTHKGVLPIIKIPYGDTELLVTQAGATNLDQNILHDRRVRSFGEYDSFFGFIVGGSTSADGDKFNVTLKLRGAPGMPTWMQSQHLVKKYDQPNTENGNSVKVDNTDIAPKFSIVDLNMTDATVQNYIQERRFKYMFNSLPEHRRTKSVQGLLFKRPESGQPGFQPADFINMDPVISRTLTAFKSAATIDNGGGNITTVGTSGTSGTSGTTSAASNTATAGPVSPDVVTAGGYHIPKEKIFSDKEFIRFEKAIEILNKNEGLTAFRAGNKNIYLTVDIQDCIIGAFPYIYSTDSDKLIIPGEIPDFKVFFLNQVEATLEWPIKNPVNVSPGPEYDFAQSTDLTTGPHRENAKYWGYLKNLYINFNLFKTTLEDQNLNMRQVLEKLLNEMSSAVNGFWNFQIVEKHHVEAIKKNEKTGKDEEIGTTRYTIIDENWVGKNTSKPVEFYHMGEQSRFLEANLTVDIPGAMTNQIVAKRLDYATNPNAPTLKIGGLFSSKPDMFSGKLEMKRDKSGDFTGSKPKGPIVVKQYMEVAVTNPDGTKTTQVISKDVDFATQADADAYKAIQKDLDANDTFKKTTVANAKANVDAATKKLADYKSDHIIYDQDEIKKLSDAIIPFQTEYDKQLKIYNDEQDRCVAKAREINKANEDTKQSNLSANFDKITILPDTNIADIPQADLDQSVFDVNKFDTYFNIYACKDTAFFDVLKQNAFGGGTTGTGRYSHPLPIKYQFTVYGTSGIRRGDTFNIIGIPEKYRKHGLFQVTEVEQTISDMKWTTKVLGEYRQEQ